MRKVFLVLLAAAITAGFLSVREANADGNIIVHRTASVGFGNNCGGYGYGGMFWDPYALNRTLRYTPPYFALHPPVYYSHNVAVPYGMSPFAISSYSPSSTTVAERPTPEPQVVVNPYVEQEVASDEPTAEPAIEEQAGLQVFDAQGSEVAMPAPAIVINEL